MVINMIYDHIVKHNGKYYAPGEEVPENTEPLSNHEMKEELNKDNTMQINTELEKKETARRGRPKKA